MDSLVSRIKQELVSEPHCAIYEPELSQLWPLWDEEREKKITEFAAQNGFRMVFYSKGLCAIFAKAVPEGADGKPAGRRF
jgi:hypothetical protein